MKTSLLAAALIAATPAAAVNLVSNGSFESGLASWTVGGTETQGFPPVAIFYNSATQYPTGAYGEAVPVNTALTNSPDAAGSRAAYFVSDFADGLSLSQTIFLEPGIYQVGFSAYAPGNGYTNKGEATFSGTIAGVTLADYAVSEGPKKSWETFKGAAHILSAGSYTIDFVFNTNLKPSKDVVIDQVYVIAGNPGVPEPGTWAMMITGFGLVGALIRRRRLAVA
jgi:hypothetical protein